jgi:hypothetical protein
MCNLPCKLKALSSKPSTAKKKKKKKDTNLKKKKKNLSDLHHAKGQTDYGTYSVQRNELLICLTTWIHLKGIMIVKKSVSKGYIQSGPKFMVLQVRQK